MISDSASKTMDAQALEDAASYQLGRLLFSFSRLDFSLNMVLLWAEGGQGVERLTQRLESQSFHQKLQWLQELTRTKFPDGSPVQLAYSQWLDRADGVRKQRNRLVHGRWGINPHTQAVINVLGIPGSVHQEEVRYSLQELQVIVADVSSLSDELDQYARKIPLCNAASLSL